ncbi:THAP domain-containing protein 3-like [Hydra vulgaris]|uniref:THAP domain-containing protein 3-like n=1 Tax=Hydra vulgaris TaxID=6087 RepID=A0ABM4BN59_HYDVU
MVNTCAVIYCKTGYEKRENRINFIPEKQPLFGFSENNPDLLNQWVVFINRKLLKPSKNSAICAKHFEEKYLKIGKRVTLIWDLNPVPIIYCLPEKIPLSVYPTTSKGRKPPSVRQPSNNQDESNLFIE